MSGNPLTMLLLTSAANSALQGIAANKAGKANQMISNANAALYRQSAVASRKNAEFNAQRQREKGQKIVSSGRTGYAKANVEIAGTPVEVLGNMVADIEFDALTTIYGGEIDAQTKLNQADMLEYEGRIARKRGKQEMYMNFAGSGISLIGAGYASGKIPPIPNPFSGMMSSPTLPSGGASGGGIGFTLPVDISA